MSTEIDFLQPHNLEQFDAYGGSGKLDVENKYIKKKLERDAEVYLTTCFFNKIQTQGQIIASNCRGLKNQYLEAREAMKLFRCSNLNAHANGSMKVVSCVNGVNTLEANGKIEVIKSKVKEVKANGEADIQNSEIKTLSCKTSPVNITKSKVTDLIFLPTEPQQQDSQNKPIQIILNHSEVEKIDFKGRPGEVYLENGAECFHVINGKIIKLINAKC